LRPPHAPLPALQVDGDLSAVGEGKRDEREELAGLEAAKQLVEGADLVRQDELPQLLDVGAIAATITSSPRGRHKEGCGGRWRRQQQQQWRL
jgi:hypothetical protein